MRKYSKILLISSLVLVGGFVLLNISELSYADEKDAKNVFEMPPEIQKYQQAFKKSCKKSELGCKEYGSSSLVSDQNTGRLRPKQRMRIMHTSLDAIKEKLEAFPSPDRKRKAMENIANRMAVFKDNV